MQEIEQNEWWETASNMNKGHRRRLEASLAGAGSPPHGGSQKLHLPDFFSGLQMILNPLISLYIPVTPLK